MPTIDSFNDKLTAHLPRLRTYAIFLTRNRAAADDLVQETAYRALRSRTQFQAGTSFTSWTYRILRNEFLSSLRRSKRTPDSIDAVPEEVLGRRGDQESIVLTREVFRAMMTLRPGQREVLMLTCADGLTYEEAADILKCSVGTIKSRLWRARKHMASLILGDEAVSVASDRRVAAPMPLTAVEPIDDQSCETLR